MGAVPAGGTAPRQETTVIYHHMKPWLFFGKFFYIFSWANLGGVAAGAFVADKIAGSLPLPPQAVFLAGMGLGLGANLGLPGPPVLSTGPAVAGLRRAPPGGPQHPRSAQQRLLSPARAAERGAGGAGRHPEPAPQRHAGRQLAAGGTVAPAVPGGGRTVVGAVAGAPGDRDQRHRAA